ncbi:hypothetical protein N826_25490 [Skermanella aerolata KACC 11604]|nr:hypothetical protein N826_25490 [Skermanella aerolata KACC 11604]
MSGRERDDAEDPDLTDFDFLGGGPVPWIYTEDGVAWHKPGSG